MIEWMAQAALLREASAAKKMKYRSLLFCLNEITHYLMTGSELSEVNLNV